MEVVYKQITKESVVFSKQYLVDCALPYNGCSGGRPQEGFEYAKENQYLRSEDDWPFTADCEHLILIPRDLSTDVICPLYSC